MAKLSHIGLYVKDVERARCFFVEYLGAMAGKMCPIYLLYKLERVIHKSSSVYAI